MSLTIKPASVLRLRPDLARRSHAPPRSRRGPHPHRARVQGLGRRRRIQHRPRPAQMLRPARPPSAPRSSTTRSASSSRISSCRAASPPTSSSGARTTASAAPCATASTSPSAASASAAPSAFPTAATPPPRQLKPGDFDWDHIFGKLGVRWFHTGGIFAALSDTTAAAHRRGRQGRQQARHHRQLRPQLPPVALENHRRPEEGAGGQPRDRQVRRRHDRQRGGLHRLARLRGRRASTTTSATSRPTPSRR